MQHSHYFVCAKNFKLAMRDSLLGFLNSFAVVTKTQIEYNCLRRKEALRDSVVFFRPMSRRIPTKPVINLLPGPYFPF